MYQTSAACTRLCHLFAACGWLSLRQVRFVRNHTRDDPNTIPGAQAEQGVMLSELCANGRPACCMLLCNPSFRCSRCHLSKHCIIKTNMSVKLASRPRKRHGSHARGSFERSIVAQPDKHGGQKRGPIGIHARQSVSATWRRYAGFQEFYQLHHD